VTDSYVYDSFGNILLTSGSTTNWFRYIGRVGYYYDIDPSDYYLRARSYDPASGHFLSRDPLTFVNLFPADLANSYRYARNNPLSLVDPRGFDATPIIVWAPPSPPPVAPPNITWDPFTFGYGRYCGYYRNGPGPPIDGLDYACQRHDRCWARWYNVACDILIDFNKCNQDFCRDLKRAESSWCDLKYGKNTQASNTCKLAANRAQRLFCLAGATKPRF